MVYILHSKITHPLPLPIFRRYLKALPPTCQVKTLGYRRWQDRQATMFGKLLLIQALLDLEATSTISNLRYTVYDRPFLDEKLDFNISHSGEYVVCAISRTSHVGIDIERIHQVDLDDYESQWTKKELDGIVNANHPHTVFFDWWTRKEAVLKASGLGLNIELNKIDITTELVTVNDGTWYLQKFNISHGYSCHLATSKAEESIVSKAINYYQDDRAGAFEATAC